MEDDVQPGMWAAELEELLVRVVGHRFGRVDLRRRMRAYVRGLLGPVGRKNGWQLAEYVAGHRARPLLIDNRALLRALHQIRSANQAIR